MVVAMVVVTDQTCSKKMLVHVEYTYGRKKNIPRGSRRICVSRPCNCGVGVVLIVGRWVIVVVRDGGRDVVVVDAGLVVSSGMVVVGRGHGRSWALGRRRPSSSSSSWMPLVVVSSSHRGWWLVMVMFEVGRWVVVSGRHGCRWWW